MKIGATGIRNWSVLGLLVLLAALLAPFQPRSRLFWAAFWDGTHFLAFAVVTTLVYVGLAGAGRSFGRRLVLAVISSIAFSAAVEWVQPYFSRQGSVHDVITGLYGVLAALFGLLVWRSGVRQIWRFGHLAVCLIVFAFVMRPAMIEWKACTWRTSQFPLIADFEDPRERPLWSTRRPGVQISFVDRFPTSGSSSLEVRVDAGTDGGVGYDAGFQDWRPFGALAFDIHNSGDPFLLTLLVIDDSYSAFLGERFTGRFKLTTGWNEIRIPMGQIRSGPKERELNVGAVFRLLWAFKASPERDLEFNLDHVRLTADEPVHARIEHER